MFSSSITAAALSLLFIGQAVAVPVMPLPMRRATEGSIEARHTDHSDHVASIGARHTDHTDHVTPIGARHTEHADHAIAETVAARHIAHADHVVAGSLEARRSKHAGHAAAGTVATRHSKEPAAEHNARATTPPDGIIRLYARQFTALKRHSEEEANAIPREETQTPSEEKRQFADTDPAMAPDGVLQPFSNAKREVEAAPVVARHAALDTFKSGPIKRQFADVTAAMAPDGNVVPFKNGRRYMGKSRLAKDTVDVEADEE